ncbi:DUF6927 domain-containing protein [Streptomyces sp. 7N604]|uniref:DUF6927 domain-containing protein n=1 Tax=Streptomyces sp. 7N604 TaxID=3457415 RepID=UPI003FD020D4
MGWTFYHRDKGVESNAEHFAKELDDRYEIIAHGTVDHVFYAAVRDRETGKVFAYVALTHWRRDANYNFGYKDMDENMGPGDCKAPEAVLDALTPTTHKYALQWRANCRRHHDQRAFLRKQLKPGTRLRLTHPLRFSNDTTRDTFTYTRSRGRGYLAHNGCRYQVRHWRDSVAAIIRPDGSESLTPVGEHHQANTNEPQLQAAAEPQPTADAR